MDQESSKQSRILNTNNENEKLISNESVTNRKSSRQIESDELNSSVNDLSINSQQEEFIDDQTSKLSYFIFLSIL